MNHIDESAHVLQALGLTPADVEAHVFVPDELRSATSKALVAATASPPSAPAPIPGPCRLDAEGFGTDLHTAVSGGLAGYTIQVRRGGTPVLSRSWQFARVFGDGNIPWSNDVPTHLASVSKLIAALALTRVLRDLGIPRTTAITPWLPLYWNWGQNTQRITFEELMTHTSGLNFGPGPTPNNDPGPADFLSAKQQILMGTTHLGQRCYQNCNYVLCRILMATLTGAISVSAIGPSPAAADSFWDLVTIAAYERYVRDHVLTPAGVTGTLDHPTTAALAYKNPPVVPGWDSGDLHNTSAAAGWHLSVDDLLDVVGTARRTDAILRPGETHDMLEAGCGTEPARDLTWGRVYWKGGFWSDGSLRTEQSSVCLLPGDVELGVLANSGYGPAGQGNIVEQIFTAIEDNTLLDFPIRGVLLAGQFRTQRELIGMSFEDMRNTLIVELTKHSNQTDYQAYDNPTLAGIGAVTVFLRRFGIRDDAALAMMSADDQRNTLIVELDAQTGAGRTLQAFTNMQLVMIGLGSDLATRGQVVDVVSSWIRGVLLLGGFRTQYELNAMSHEDMRNTLIVELTKHSNQTNYEAYNDAELEGMGAVLVLLCAFDARTDVELKTMTADDQRNTLIVELDAQTNTGLKLQRLTNLQLALTALGWWERRH